MSDQSINQASVQLSAVPFLHRHLRQKWLAYDGFRPFSFYIEVINE